MEEQKPDCGGLKGKWGVRNGDNAYTVCVENKIAKGKVTGSCLSRASRTMSVSVRKEKEKVQ